MGTSVRSCVACRQRRDKPTLVRLVAAGGAVVVDPAARKPGRGAYVCPDRDCLDTALRRGGASLLRALRQRVEVDEQSVRAGWSEAVTTRVDTARGEKVSA